MIKIKARFFLMPLVFTVIGLALGVSIWRAFGLWVILVAAIFTPLYISMWRRAFYWYRKLMNSPFAYAVLAAEAFGNMEPQTAEGCALYRENGGFCQPNEPDVCLRCSGFEKKGKKSAKSRRVSD